MDGVLAFEGTGKLLSGTATLGRSPESEKVKAPSS
jgi:hypothetical protein